MKRTLFVCTLAVMFVSSLAFGQDLAEAARQARAMKKNAPATKVWTNEDIRSVPEPAPAAADAKAAPADAKAEAADAKKEPSADDKKKLTADYQAQANDLKKQISMLSQEADLADREFKLQVANYYADAGNSLRDPKKWSDERDAKQKEINDKKQAVADAKTKLDDLIEKARKDGVNLSQ